MTANKTPSTDSQAVGQALQQAITLHQAGNLQEAELLYRTILKARPDHPDANHNLGVLAVQVQQPSAGLPHFKAALEANPDQGQYWLSYIDALIQTGQTDVARQVLEEGRQHGLQGESVETVAGRLPPGTQEISSLTTLFGEGRYAEAEATARRLTEIFPHDGVGWKALGAAFKLQGQTTESLEPMRKAAELMPEDAEAHSNLGAALKDLGQLEDAVASFRRAIEIDPYYANAHSNMGVALQTLEQLSGAVASHRRALEINPNSAENHFNLGNSMLAIAQLDNAVAKYRKALEIKPDYLKAHSNLIFTLDLTAGADITVLQHERNRWNLIHAAPLAANHYPHANHPDPERRLRIGYVSADFRVHSASQVFGFMLVNFDPTYFDVFAYSNSTIVDSCTCIFKERVTHWRNISALSDDAVAEMIRQDSIDILVDLSGHSLGNRLLVFARKPAPIQITAWGYIGGTGLKAMDVFFADPVIVPPDEKHFYAEEVRYLPNVVGHYSSREFPAVNPLPALSADRITFGSFNRLAKVSDQAYQVWAQLLLAIPDSMMVLKTGELDDAVVKERVVKQFTKAGVDPSRIKLLGKSAWDDHIAAFGQVDIALDPFPHCGGVTTLEELMMGVPVVTLRCPTVAGRLSASILSTLGLTDWISESPEQYIEIAKQKAKNLTALADLRQQLRTILTTSIIGDNNAYVRAVEKEYRQLWREWCGNRDSSHWQSSRDS